MALACAAGTAGANPAWQQCLVVGIADGDTLTARCGTSGHYQQLRVRLAGIDAPEKRQPYGERARQALADLMFPRSARLECATTNRYGRNICTVWTTQDAGEQIDVGHALIERGMAWWYRAYARAQPAPQRQQYEAAELTARASRIGIWSDVQAAPPWDWWRGERPQCTEFARSASVPRASERHRSVGGCVPDQGKHYHRAA